MLDELAQAIETLLNRGRTQFKVRVARTSYQNIHVLVQSKGHPLTYYIDDHEPLWSQVWNARSDEAVVLQAAQWVLEQDPLSIHATLVYDELMEAERIGQGVLANHVVYEAAQVWAQELQHRVRVRHQPQIQTQVVERVVYKEPERQRWTDWLLSFIPAPKLAATALVTTIYKGQGIEVWSPSGASHTKPYLFVRDRHRNLILGTESIEDAWTTARRQRGLVYIEVYGDVNFWLQNYYRQFPDSAQMADLIERQRQDKKAQQRAEEDAIARHLEEAKANERRYS